MYSMVLMAALTTGVDLPDRGHRGGGCCGCYGGGYGGCYGGGHGCGCYGGGYGMGYGGCCGCYGGYGMGMGYGGCMGMSMGGGCMGMSMGGGCMGGGMMMQGAGTIQQGGTGGEKLKNAPTEKGGRGEVTPNTATIVVDLPADAKLLIDDTATTSTGANRVFQSPELKPGKTFHYTLTAEVVRNNKPVKIEQVIEVKAGVTTPVRMTVPAVGAAQR